MPIPYTCPYCGRETNVADQFAGTTGQCAGCGNSITIPGKPVPGSDSEPTAEFAGAAPGMAPVPAPKSSGGSTGLIVAIVAISIMCVCIGPGILAALLLPAVQSAREAARRVSCKNNLRMVALACHNYHDTYKSFPAGVVLNPEDQPMHSWRMAITPFMEASNISDRYDYNQSWDSSTNSVLEYNRPLSYACPSSEIEPNQTNYIVAIGDTAVFRKNYWTRFADIIDGTSNTILATETNQPIHWMSPNDPLLDDMNLVIDQGPIGSRHPRGVNVAMCDGSVKFVRAEMSPQDLRSLLEPADGKWVEVVE